MNWIVIFLCITASLFAEDKNHYVAAVGSLATEGGKEQIGYISYKKESEPGRERPLTFAFNGGPGSSSVWLHLGAFGPKRILSPEEHQALVPPYKMVDNLETILDLTDLVFIDPVGTGLNKPNSPEEAPSAFYGVSTDIQAIGAFIRDYLIENNRWNSPKYIAGESYGALRACGLSHYLQEEYGIYLNGLLLISPAIDYQTFLTDIDNPIPYFLFLPTYAATAWHYGRFLPQSTLEEAVAKARTFAYESYAPSLLCRKCFPKEPLYSELAAITGLSLPLIYRCQGRIEENLFLGEFFGDENKLLGRYDTRLNGRVSSSASFFLDPSTTAIDGIFSASIHDYLQNDLGCCAPYNLISFDVHRQWSYNTSSNQIGFPNTLSSLRAALTANPVLKIFVGCGYFDCATPFAATEYCLDHLEIPEAFVQMEYYEGGHMYYLNPSARIKFKQDLIKFYAK